MKSFCQPILLFISALNGGRAHYGARRVVYTSVRRQVCFRRCSTPGACVYYASVLRLKV